MIKPHTVMYVRTTEEPVFVLELVEDGVLVRRPVQSRDGIRYEKAVFVHAELESREDRIARILTESKEYARLQREAQQSDELDNLNVAAAPRN